MRRVVCPDHHQLSGIFVGERAQEHTFHDRKNSGVRTDANSEREHDRKGKERVATELPAAVTEVVRCRVPKGDATRIAALLAHLFHAAEGHPGASSRVGAAKTGSHQFVGLMIEVKLQLLVKFALYTVPVKNGAHSIKKVGKHAVFLSCGI
jgi:hypothetical protein